MTRSRTTSCVSRPPPAATPCPWLIFSHGKHSNTQTFYIIPEGHYYVKRIPDLSEKDICTSSNGWMVMLDNYSDDCFLLNPISMEKIKLPRWKPFSWRNCVLSLPPTDPNCIVAFFHSDKPCIMFCRPGEKEWVEQEFGYEDEIHHVTVCEGIIYGLRHFHELVRLDVGDGGLAMRRLGAGKAPSSSPLLPEVVRCRACLVESCGEIFLVAMSFLGEAAIKVRDIEVYKMDFASLNWVRVESLEGRAFFLNKGSNCMSCSATESGIKGNSIYFVQGKTDREADMSMYVFDIEENSIHVSLPCPNVVHNWLQTVWVTIQSCP